MPVATARRAKEAQQQESEIVVGRILRTLFHNEQSGYAVIVLQPTGEAHDRLYDSLSDDTITAVGYLSGVREGDEIRLAGTWVTHPKYGRQFKFTEHEVLLPSGREGIVEYLASVADGIGPVKAGRIVDALGLDCLDKIRENPDVLRTLPFVKPEQVEQIASHLQKNQVQAELTALICRQGITPRLAAKIYAAYGAESLQVVKDNPYMLADDVWGVGFKTADLVAQAVGIKPDSPFRVEAAVKYVLRTAAGEEGHVYLDPKNIVRLVLDLLGKTSGIGVPHVAEAVSTLASREILVREGHAVYHQALYHAECQVAERMRSLAGRKKVEWEDLDDAIFFAEMASGIEYAPEQREAIRTALTSGLSIITGGPGTGKTTVINAICDIYAQEYPAYDIYLAAPTGRAAKRMSEATGREAKTIHRLLHYSSIEGGFEYGWGNPLPGPGLLIVDEFSMCDIELARDLLAAVDDLQVVLVGDVDQLPSVGPGSVLRDAISSRVVPTVRLKFNYRQAGGSKIAEYANMVCQGIVMPLQSSGDFCFVEVDDADEVAPIVAELVKQALAEGLSVMDFQVLAPMRKGSAGVNALNELVREIVNPKQPGENECKGFRPRDKVMVVKNNYNLGVFNGDLGQVVDVGRGEVLVRFEEGFLVPFRGDDLELLQLAYACTVHKAQGSEFPLVIMPLVKQHYIMLQRNLLYTGMTRAQKRLVLIADPWAVKAAVQNDKVAERFSRLAERLKGDGVG
ncbi:MAG TPA: ATP-dependent RecD-like DNA helicase [Firmicutes bacterium]|nr:ATP-dependent RecD-like DNA helicase [Bacillota bacterium]